MGSTRGDRELRRLETAYVAAVLHLATAMRRFHEAQIPLDPGTPANIVPWTADQIRAVVAVRDAWNRLVDTRQEYDRSLPELRRYAPRRPRGGA